jgi:hypothetical protein
LAYCLLAREYRRVPRTAIPDPMPPRRDIGDLKTMQDATMITTLLRVLATLWVTGPGGEGGKG